MAEPREGFVPPQEARDTGYEQGKEFVPTFDDAVEAFLDAPIYGKAAEGITKTGEGKFHWDRNNIELTITPDKVEVPDDEHGPYQTWIDMANEAQAFAKSIEELWPNLPGAAQTKENLQAMAVAKTLEGYRKSQE